jgi:gamma-glutamylcyclotransferase (GGCT)/AIG2-like uncharacterized protein YtfP
MIQLPLFVFGTLRRDERNHHYLAGAFDGVQPAMLSGFCRVETLMIARQPDSAVQGELFDLTPATYARTLQGCDHLEEIPVGELVGHEYRRIPVRVQSANHEVIAWAYVRPDAEPDADLLDLTNQELLRLANL